MALLRGVHVVAVPKAEADAEGLKGRGVHLDGERPHLRHCVCGGAQCIAAHAALVCVQCRCALTWDALVIGRGKGATISCLGALRVPRTRY